MRSAAAALKSSGSVDLAALEKVAHEQLLTLEPTGKAMMTPLFLEPLRKP